jgi:ribosomal protein S18 acetylase RimI-like enzyme
LLFNVELGGLMKSLAPLEAVSAPAPALADACVAVYNRAMSTELGAQHSPLDAQTWSGTFDGASWSSWLVARDERGDVAGFCLACGYDGGPAVLQMLAVEPSRQGQGLGRALLAATLEAFDALGQSLAVAFVREGSTRSQAFYASHGGVVGYGVQDRDYYGKPVHPVLFGVGPGGRPSAQALSVALRALSVLQETPLAASLGKD